MSEKHLLPHELDELSDGPATFAWRAHLASCAACREEWAARVAVVRALSRLPHLAPRRELADRVLAAVRRPEPAVLARLRALRDWAAAPRRRAALVTGYAVSAVVSLGVVVPWLLEHQAAISFVTSWVVARAGAMVGQAVLALAAWALTSPVYASARDLTASAGQVAVLAAALSVAYGGCAAGLGYLLKTPRGEQGRGGKDGRVPVTA